MSRAPKLLLLLVAPAFALLWLDIFMWPALAITPGGDVSWSAALIHFAAEKFQFGTEVIFSYGPFSHLITFIYTGELLATRVVWEVVSKTSFAALLCLATLRLPKIWRLPFFLFLFAFVWADGAADTLYFLVISCLTAFLLINRSRYPWLLILAGSFFAIASLIKFTYALLALLAVIVVVAAGLVQGRPRRGFVLLGTFVLAFLICWGVAGQNYQNLPAYFSTSMDVSSYYKGAMSLPAASNSIVVVGAAVALLALLQCGLISMGTGLSNSTFFSVFLIGQIFLVWNRAFVRADDHVLSFFCLTPLILLTSFLVSHSESRHYRVASWICSIVFVLSLSGIVLQRPTGVGGWVPQAFARIPRTWHIVTHPNEHFDQLSNQLAEARKTYDLPRVRAQVGRQPIDVFGHEQGIALLNHLNYQPRPAFQGYSAYAPSLIAMNTAHYASPAAPEYVLYKVQTIDNRYPSLDDAGALKQLLLNYEPLLEERDYLLWKKTRPPVFVSAETTMATSLPFEKELTIPSDGMQWLELEVKPSWLGRALNFFYKAPQVTLRVTDNAGHQTGYRLIPSMASEGFLINPYLDSLPQVLRTVSGKQPALVTSISVHVTKRNAIFFRQAISVRLGQLPKPAPTELSDELQRLSGQTSEQ